MSIQLMQQVWSLTTTTGSERLVLLALADAANDEGLCWPSLAKIAEKANISKRYVIDIIKKLQDKSLLIVEHRHDNSGDFTSNYYKVVVNQSSLGSEQEITTGSEQEFTTGSELGITRVVNQGSLKPSVNRNIDPLINAANSPQDERQELSACAKFYFGIFNRKRWSNKKQAEYFSQLEGEFGEDILHAAINWAAVKNISDLSRIRAACTTMKRGSGSGGITQSERNIGRAEDGGLYV